MCGGGAGKKLLFVSVSSLHTKERMHPRKHRTRQIMDVDPSEDPPLDIAPKLKKVWEHPGMSTLQILDSRHVSLVMLVPIGACDVLQAQRSRWIGKANFI